MIPVRAAGAVLLLLLAGCGASAAAPVIEAEGVAPPAPVVAPSALPSRAPVATRPVVPAGCSARAEACVSTEHRLAWLQRRGRVVHGPVPVSLGTRADPTPRGHFRVAWKDAEHTSSIYGIDMPWSVFFATGGIAFHQGPIDEASHGCVHLAPAAAEAFFDALDRGDRVHVY